MNAWLAALCAALAVMVVLPAARTDRLSVISGRRATPAIASPMNMIRVGPAARRRATARRNAVLDVLTAFAAELHAGVPPTRALTAASSSIDQRICPATDSALAMGGDVAAALEIDADTEGLPLLRSVAACWRVGESSGAGLTLAIERLATSARSVEDAHVQLEAQLATPRATARMLAMLPGIGIVMGMLLGADPLGWLLTPGFGLLCLIAGVGLTVSGLVWTGRISAAVTRNA